MAKFAHIVCSFGKHVKAVVADAVSVLVVPAFVVIAIRDATVADQAMVFIKAIKVHVFNT
jgi:hypothetical protein